MKEIEGYNGKYLISPNGDVYSTRRRGCNGQYLKPHLNSNGYLKVDLRKGKERTLKLIHRLVAEAFIPNPDNKPCVNHKDGNKHNNDVNNLEWCTYSENMKHAFRNELNHVPGLNGEEHPLSKLKKEDVELIKSMKNTNITGSELGKRYNVTKEAIYNIWNGKTWK